MQLHVTSIPTTALTPETIQSLDRIRRSTMRAADGGEIPEEDIESFTSFVESYDRVFVFTDSDHVIRGFFVESIGLGSWEDKAFVWLHLEDMFVEEGFRKTPAPYRAFVEIAAELTVRYPTLPGYLMTAMYPASFLVLAESKVTTYVASDPDCPSWERELLEHYGQRLYGERWDREHRLVHPRLVAGEAPPPHFHSQVHAEAFERYERLNPTWREGTAVFALVPIDARRAAAALGRRLMQSTRRLRRSRKR